MIQKYLWAITGLKKQRKEASLHYPLKKRERAQKPYSQAGEINIFSLFLCRKNCWSKNTSDESKRQGVWS